MFKIVIEKFFENMEEATIGKWLKEEGDLVQEGEPLVEIITDKVTFELESPFSGTVRRVVSKEKSVVPVGYVIALIGDPTEEVPDVEAENEELMSKLRKEAVAEALLVTSRAPSEAILQPTAPFPALSDRVRATPAARRLAKQQGLNLAQVAAEAGVEVVSERDVLAYLERRGKAS